MREAGTLEDSLEDSLEDDWQIESDPKAPAAVRRKSCKRTTHRQSSDGQWPHWQ